jgi:hypothetical protein
MGLGPYIIGDISLLKTLPGRPAVIPAVDKANGVQCVGLVKYYSNCGAASSWKKGASVNGLKTLAPCTVIATFNANGIYPNHARGNHACFFIRFLPDGAGIEVLEQHVPPNPNRIQTRSIKFRGATSPVSPSDNADTFSVVL